MGNSASILLFIRWLGFVFSFSTAILSYSPLFAEPSSELINLNSTEINADQLQRAIIDRLKRVKEFAFIRKEAEKIGVKVFIFGGTAAGFAHYVKWDLQREMGDNQFPALKFDYHFTHIYRANQDIDIVVDGSAEQAYKLREIIAHSPYNYVRGAKSSWDIRLLKTKFESRLGLLDDFNFLNQHSDSNSTGLIELTKSDPGSFAIRDLRDWSNPYSNFIEDVRLDKIHFYFASRHEETELYRTGRNPPIFSVIRYFIKAFQYQLATLQEDEKNIRSIIDAFEPRANLNSHIDYWIAKNAPNLFAYSANVEFASKTLEKFGLKRKLIDFFNAKGLQKNATELRRVPLPTLEVGLGTGATAKDLGIDIVAHETKSFEAYENITRSPRGEPNVFISRSSATEECATFGNGFYTKRGTEGARGTRITIRYKVKSHAREGHDFFIPSTENSFVIFLNKAAFTVIPEGFDIGPSEYLALIENNDKILKDQGVLYRLKQRLSNDLALLSDEEFKNFVNRIFKLENTDTINLLLTNIAHLDRLQKMAYEIDYAKIGARLKVIVRWINENRKEAEVFLKESSFYDLTRDNFRDLFMRSQTPDISITPDEFVDLSRGPYLFDDNFHRRLSKKVSTDLSQLSENELLSFIDRSLRKLNLSYPNPASLLYFVISLPLKESVAYKISAVLKTLLSGTPTFYGNEDHLSRIFQLISKVKPAQRLQFIRSVVSEESLKSSSFNQLLVEHTKIFDEKPYSTQLDRFAMQILNYPRSAQSSVELNIRMLQYILSRDRNLAYIVRRIVQNLSISDSGTHIMIQEFFSKPESVRYASILRDQLITKNNWINTDYAIGILNHLVKLPHAHHFESAFTEIVAMNINSVTEALITKLYSQPLGLKYKDELFALIKQKQSITKYELMIKNIFTQPHAKDLTAHLNEMLEQTKSIDQFLFWDIEDSDTIQRLSSDLPKSEVSKYYVEVFAKLLAHKKKSFTAALRAHLLNQPHFKIDPYRPLLEIAKISSRRARKKALAKFDSSECLKAIIALEQK